MRGSRLPRQGSTAGSKRNTGGKTVLILTDHSFHFGGGRGAAGVTVPDSHQAVEPRPVRRPVPLASSSARADHWIRVTELSPSRAEPSQSKR